MNPGTLGYRLKFYDVDGLTDSEQSALERRFRAVLEKTLGDALLVAPVYLAYQRIVATYGETPDPDLLSEAERAIFEQWQAAETAAVTATFGPNRYMGDAMYEIRVLG